MKTPRLLVEKVPTVVVCWVHRLTGILWSKNTISWSLGRKSSGEKDRSYLLRNRAVIDLGVCLGVKALFQPLPPCFDPDLIVHIVYPADSLILSLLKL